MQNDDLKEVINTIFEGIISLVVVVGAGIMLFNKPDPAIIGLCGAASSAVLVFWFGQRGTAKATDGTITALSKLSSQIGVAQERAIVSPPSITETIRADTAAANAATAALAALDLARRMP
jgi:hypothetical protein